MKENHHAPKNTGGKGGSFSPIHVANGAEAQSKKVMVQGAEEGDGNQ
jgi:hypothetical protein